MRWLSLLFVRTRWLFGLFLIVVSLLAAWGYVPTKAVPQGVSKSTDLVSGDDAGEDEDDQPGRDEAVRNSFNLGSSDAFLVVECDDLFSANTVRSLRAMVRAIEALPYVETVFWLDDVPLLNVFGLADPLLPPDDAAEESFAQARDAVLNHPLVRGQLLSTDGRTLMMPVVYNWLYMQEERDLTDGVTEAARVALDGAASPSPQSLSRLASPADGGGEPDVRVRITGNVPLFLAREEAFARNQTMFRVIGYGLALLLSIIMFRGVAAVFIVSAAPMLGVFWTIGLLKLGDVHINELATVVMPVLVSMIGLTDGVHLLVNIRERRTAGDSPMEASRWAIEYVGVACFLTSLTTAIGFGSLMLADSRFVREFGEVCMYGVVIAFTAIITFIPLMASTRLGRNVHRGQELDFVGPYLRRSRGLLEYVLRYRGTASAVTVGLTVLMAAVSLTLRPDNRIANQLPSSSEAYQALAHCDEHLGGIQFMSVFVHWDESIANDAPEILAAVRAAEAVINTEPLVSYPLSIRNMLASMPGDPDDLTTQMTFLSLLPKDLRGFFFREEQRSAQIVAHVQDRGIAQYVPVFDRLDEKLAALEADYPGFEIWQQGGPLRMANNLYQIVVDLTKSLGAASFVIFIVLAIVYRSLRLGLISIIPNLFPLVATGALLVAMGEPLFISSVCAFTVCLGIAVDDTIHFLSRYRQELAAADSVDDAVRATYITVGTPMLMTTIILVVGFSTVLLSDLPAHRIFGAMACATIGSAIIGDLLGLPALLAYFEAGEHKPKATE